MDRCIDETVFHKAVKAFSTSSVSSVGSHSFSGRTQVPPVPDKFI